MELATLSIPPSLAKYRRIIPSVRCAFCVGVLASLWGIPSIARAESLMTLGFSTIPNSVNNQTNAEIGMAQLKVDVSTVSNPNQVKFVFSNEGPYASSITDIYFEDGPLFGISYLIDADDGIGGVNGDSGVDFTAGSASPPNLPSGNNATPAFQVTAGFLADSDPAAQPNGVNPFETLAIVFDLKNGQNVFDVLDALRRQPGDELGSLRIGIHVQGFQNGGSESFINTPPGPPDESTGIVPEPASLSLFGIGLVALYGYRRRKQNQKREQSS
jgi:hypothetical protein